MKTCIDTATLSKIATALYAHGEPVLAGECHIAIGQTLRDGADKQPERDIVPAYPLYVMVTECATELGVHLGPDRCRQAIRECHKICDERGIVVGQRDGVNGGVYPTFPRHVVESVIAPVQSNG